MLPSILTVACVGEPVVPTVRFPATFVKLLIVPEATLTFAPASLILSVPLFITMLPVTLFTVARIAPNLPAIDVDRVPSILVFTVPFNVALPLSRRRKETFPSMSPSILTVTCLGTAVVPTVRLPVTPC